MTDSIVTSTPAKSRKYVPVNRFALAADLLRAGAVAFNGFSFLVRSQSSNVLYRVRLTERGYLCDCQDRAGQATRRGCKHIIAAKAFRAARLALQSGRFASYQDDVMRALVAGFPVESMADAAMALWVACEVVAAEEQKAVAA